jgi:glycine/D-amino acid oxidase-like deaminating enzyme
VSQPAACDVVIVGGGIAGVMSAYHLALAGRKVLLVERSVIAGEAETVAQALRETVRHVTVH